MKLSEITNQSISSLICDYLVCPNCGVIDRDFERMIKGYNCPICNAESEAGRLFFDLTVSTLTDLLQQTYHSSFQLSEFTSQPQSSDVGTIILFCTIREVLLTNFIIRLLRAKNIPVEIIEKLLDDNKLANQKFGDLFKTATGTKWDAAIKDLSKKLKFEFIEVSNVMKKSSEVRNSIIHEGSIWSATHELSTTCINNIGSLFFLFVELHNTYVHPVIFKSHQST